MLYLMSVPASVLYVGKEVKHVAVHKSVSALSTISAVFIMSCLLVQIVSYHEILLVHLRLVVKQQTGTWLMKHVPTNAYGFDSQVIQ